MSKAPVPEREIQRDRTFPAGGFRQERDDGGVDFFKSDGQLPRPARVAQIVGAENPELVPYQLPHFGVGAAQALDEQDLPQRVAEKEQDESHVARGSSCCCASMSATIRASSSAPSPSRWTTASRIHHGSTSGSLSMRACMVHRKGCASACACSGVMSLP